MSPGFPRAELVAATDNDCQTCSASPRPGYIYVFDRHDVHEGAQEVWYHPGAYRPCPRCNPDGRDVVRDEVRRLRSRGRAR